MLAGIGALAIPGVGPLIAAGPIMAGLAGLGVGGAVGGLIGGLVGIEIGMKEYGTLISRCTSVVNSAPTSHCHCKNWDSKLKEL